MPRVNIWLPDELHRLVKAEKVPVSEVCQAALKRELAARRRRQQDATSHPGWSDNHRRTI